MPTTEDSLHEKTDVEAFVKRASGEGQGAKLRTWWKRLPSLAKAFVAVGFVTILLVVAGFTWLLTKPQDLNCASKGAEELVAQIAGEYGAMATTAEHRFSEKLPEPAEHITAERMAVWAAQLGDVGGDALRARFNRLGAPSIFFSLSE